MKPNVLFFSLCLCFVSTTPAQAADSWQDRLSGFFAYVFGWEDEPAPSPRAAPASFPLASPADGLPAFLEMDTAQLDFVWPAESIDIEGEVERTRRLGEQSQVVRDPQGLLPLAPAARVRVLYRQHQRPARMLSALRRFASLQCVAYSDVLAPALTAAPALPTLIVADDPVGAPRTDDWYRALYGMQDIILLHFGDRRLLGEVPKNWTVINCPLRARETEAVALKLLLGDRPSYRLPEEVGIDRTRFGRIDRAIQRAIRARAMPGAQLAVLKDGHLIYERGYGRHTYRRDAPAVGVNDLYDLASLTKAAATTLAVMKLYDEGRIDLNGKLQDYVEDFRGSVPGWYRIDQLLSHHTGLQASLPLERYLFAPFVKEAPSSDSDLPLGSLARRYMDGSVPARVRKACAREVTFTRVPTYRYSDINFVLLQFAVEAITGQDLATYVTDNFYRPMGLTHLTFRPRERFDDRQLVPTVDDAWMGRGLLHGEVHDEGAALLGGVAGHAGLFGNAQDLGLLFQMLTDGGRYGGRQLLGEETVRLFTQKNTFNQRALGFDRLAAGYRSVIYAGASERTFGHTGFTGTSVWADPDNGLVYVLLTNRVHPDPANVAFIERGVREATHRQLYRACGSFAPEA